MYVSTGDDGRIFVTTDNEAYTDESYFEFDFPEDFDYSLQNEYRIVDGELVHEPIGPSPSTQEQISELKQKLLDTDYMVIKVYESMVTGEVLPDEDAERYAEVIEQRKAWRIQINELEASSEGGD